MSAGVPHSLLSAFAITASGAEPIRRSGNRETVVAEPRHDGHHVAGHYPLGVWRVVSGRRRATAVAVPTKIGAYHGELRSEQRCDVPPHQQGFREAME